MTRTCLAVLLGLAALTPGGGAATRVQASTQPVSPPRLVVLIVIDQMRFEYIDRYAHLWTSGLKRLRDGGAVFDRAFYPYLNTVTCPGHATIATGAYPYRHGVIMNEWYQRSAAKRMSCTEDPGVTSVPYAPPAEPIGHSAHRLRVPTLGDRIRAATPDAHVVTLSMKPRSTVMLAGHGGTAVTWFADTNVWATSSAYTSRPLPEVQAFIDQRPVDRDRDVVWDRLRAADAYSGRDDDPSERPRKAWTSTFPHPLAGAPGTAPGEFFDLWERSPYSDDYLGRMAAALVRGYQLGRDDTVDFLGVSFSGLDYIGHDFGPESHEVQDALIRLDATIGAFLEALDATVGRDRFVIGLSSDHGVARIPEAYRAEGGDAGRVLNADVRRVAEEAMVAAHGPGPHVALVEYTNLYLSDATRARAAAEPAVVQPIIDAVAKMPGVLRVFRSAGLERERGSSDALVRAAALSYHPDESGDLIVVLKPNWIGTSTSAATHGSANAYDQHVPVVLYGAGIKPGRYPAPASPADLAPTLASLARITMPDADGRVLKEALKP